MAEGFNPYHKWLGIPLAQQPANHYRLLGISLFESDPDVIVNAADQRMAHVKSFQTGQRTALAKKLLSELAAARACLLDQGKKAAYDAALREAAAAEPSQSPSPASSGGPAGRTDTGLDFASFAPTSASSSPAQRPLRTKRKTPWVPMIAVVAGLAAVVAITVLTAPKKDRGGDSPGGAAELAARGEPKRSEKIDRPDVRPPQPTAIEDQSIHQREPPKVQATPPAVGTIDPKEVRANETLSFVVPVADADDADRRLTFELRGETHGAEISGQGVFAWTPTAQQAGKTYQFAVRVGDRSSAPQFGEGTFAVAVLDGAPPQTGPAAPSGETLDTTRLDVRGAAMGVARTLTEAAWKKTLTAAMLTQNYEGVIPVFVDRKKFTGPVSALMWCSRNKPDGATVTFWGGKDPVSVFNARQDFDRVGLKQYVNFKAGQVSGQAATWRADGKKEFLGQYTQNKRKGVCYLFRDGEVCLILERHDDGGEAVRLVSAGRVTKTFDDVEKAGSDPAARDLVREVEQIDSGLKAQQAVLQPYRAALRQRLAAELSVKHRADASARSRQRAAEDTNAWQSFIRQHAP